MDSHDRPTNRPPRRSLCLSSWTDIGMDHFKGSQVVIIDLTNRGPSSLTLLINLPSLSRSGFLRQSPIFLISWWGWCVTLRFCEGLWWVGKWKMTLVCLMDDFSLEDVKKVSSDWTTVPWYCPSKLIFLLVLYYCYLVIYKPLVVLVTSLCYLSCLSSEQRVFFSINSLFPY